MKFVKNEAELPFINSLRQVHTLIHIPSQIRVITKYNNLLPPLWLCLCSLLLSFFFCFSPIYILPYIDLWQKAKIDHSTDYITKCRIQLFSLQNQTVSKIGYSQSPAFVLHRFGLICLWIDLVVMAEAAQNEAVIKEVQICCKDLLCWKQCKIRSCTRISSHGKYSNYQINIGDINKLQRVIKSKKSCNK